MISFSMILRLAVATIWTNKFRSMLTLLGMLFGTAAVIATLSSNEGAQKFISGQLASLGANVITVNSGSGSMAADDVAAIRKHVPGIASLSTERDIGQFEIAIGSRGTSATALAVDSAWFAASGVSVDRGRLFMDLDDRPDIAVVVLGATVAQAVFGTSPPIGEFVRLRSGDQTHSAQVIGTTKTKGGSAGAALDSSIYLMPAFTAKLLPQLPPARLIVTVVDESTSAVAKGRVRALLTPRFPEDLVVSDAREAIEKTQSIWAKQNLVGICLAIISLVTGGVGIMNIMLLSIHQRQKEIGLRKAVGAQSSEVALQFLTEAVFICILGGMFGVVVGLGFGHQVARMLGEWEAVTSFSTVGVALAFAAATGVVFGLFPALRASRIDPYDALRSS